jgi:hypothetical protein
MGCAKSHSSTRAGSWCAQAPRRSSDWESLSWASVRECPPTSGAERLAEEVAALVVPQRDATPPPSAVRPAISEVRRRHYPISKDAIKSVQEDEHRVAQGRGHAGERVFDVITHGARRFKLLFDPSLPAFKLASPRLPQAEVLACWETLRLWPRAIGGGSLGGRKTSSSGGHLAAQASGGFSGARLGVPSGPTDTEEELDGISVQVADGRRRTRRAAEA